MTDAIDEENPQVTTANTQLAAVESELSSVILEIIRQFSVLMESHKAGDKEDWETWWIEGWFREFSRSIAPLLLSPSVIEGVQKMQLSGETTAMKVITSAKIWADFC